MNVPPKEFSMPMYREFVPEKIRPWIHLLFAIIFQLGSGIYLGVAANIAGAESMMTEDVLMIGMCGVVGVCIPFPFLFRFKFRYTNRQLLMNAALVMAVCNVLCIYVHSIPLLCVISFIAGFFKLCGTFECFSNIQLWIAPGRDMTIFFPVIYIVIVGSMSLSSWIAVQLAYYTGIWQMMNWLMCGMFLCVALTVAILTRNVRIMPKMPMISMDWMGCFLWSLVLLEGIWIFTYGEFYNWFDGKVFRVVCCFFAITLFACINRMLRIRHPYISPKAFTCKGLLPVLGMFAVNEIMNATSKSLQNAYTGAVLGWDQMTLSVISIVEIIGTAAGCLFVLFWIKVLKLKYTRLLGLGTLCLLAYELIMYLSVTPDLSLGRLYFPTLLRTAGYAIYFAVLTIYLAQAMPFPQFFMGMTICGFIRNGLVSSFASAVYSRLLKYYVADWKASVSEPGLWHIEPLLSGIKTLFGWTCFFGCFVLLLFLLYHVDPVRNTFKKFPSWLAVGRSLRMKVFAK